MRELSLNVMDIAQNSISAGASLIEIEVAEDIGEDVLKIRVTDNGCGMTPEQVQHVIDPFIQQEPHGAWGWVFRCSKWRRR